MVGFIFAGYIELMKLMGWEVFDGTCWVFEK